MSRNSRKRDRRDRGVKTGIPWQAHEIATDMFVERQGISKVKQALRRMKAKGEVEDASETTEGTTEGSDEQPVGDVDNGEDERSRGGV